LERYKSIRFSKFKKSMKKETQRIEFKPNFDEDVIETVVVFANAKGGQVLVGIDDQENPVRNFAIGNESVQKWINEIKTILI